jgi:hypothetical protein
MSCALTTIRGRRKLILAFDLPRAAACDFVPSLQEEHLHTRTLCTAVTLTISWPLSFLFLITHTICIILLDGSGWSAFDTKAVATPQGTGCLSNFATRTHALAPTQLQYNTHAIRTRTSSAHAIITSREVNNQSPWVSSISCKLVRSSVPFHIPTIANSPSIELTIRRNRPRALPPRATLHTPRKAHNLHQRRAICRRRIRLRILAQLDKVQLRGEQQQQEIQQDAFDWHQGVEDGGDWEILSAWMILGPGGGETERTCNHRRKHMSHSHVAHMGRTWCVDYTRGLHASNARKSDRS